MRSAKEKDEEMIIQIVNPHNLYSVKESLVNIPLDFVSLNEISLLLDERGVKTSIAEKEKVKIERLMRELCKLAQILNEKKVKYVIIKLPRLPKPLSDIDLLIIDSVVTIDVILKQMGYVLEDYSEPHRRTYVKLVDGERVVIDMHLELSWRRVIYLEKEEIWRERKMRMIDGIEIPVPCSEHELLISAAHAIFKHNKITLFDILHTYTILKRDNINMDVIERITKRNGWYKQFLFYIKAIKVLYRELYLEKGEGDSQREIERLPYIFPLHVVIALRGQKLFFDLRRFRIREVFKDSYAYLLDIVQYIFEEKLNISLSFFFNMLQFLKRRLGV